MKYVSGMLMALVVIALAACWSCPSRSRDSSTACRKSARVCKARATMCGERLTTQSRRRI